MRPRSRSTWNSRFASRSAARSTSRLTTNAQIKPFGKIRIRAFLHVMATLHIIENHSSSLVLSSTQPLGGCQPYNGSMQGIGTGNMTPDTECLQKSQRSISNHILLMGHAIPKTVEHRSTNLNHEEIGSSPHLQL